MVGFYLFAAMMGGSGKSGDSRRAARLAAALRDNLKRRKAQVKARAQAAAKAAETMKRSAVAGPLRSRANAGTQSRKSDLAIAGFPLARE